MNEKLIGLAYKVREYHLWETFNDGDIFAVKLSNGEIAYCCIMGQAGKHYGLGVYIGTAGWNTYLSFHQMALMDSDLEVRHAMCTRMDCINCDYTPSKEVEASPQKTAVLRYAKEHGIRNPRTIGIPDFVRYAPYRPGGPMTDPKDESAMTEVLAAAAHLGDLLKENHAFSLGFMPFRRPITDKPGWEVPFFVPDGKGGFLLEKTPLPGRTPEPLPAVAFDRPDLAMQLAMLPVRSNLECRFIAIDTPVMPKGEPGFFPTTLLFVDSQTEIVGFTDIDKFDAGTTPVHTVKDFALKMTASGIRPSTIFVMEDFTEALLKDFCSKTGIHLKRVRQLKHLNQAWQELSFAMRLVR